MAEKQPLWLTRIGNHRGEHLIVLVQMPIKQKSRRATRGSRQSWSDYGRQALSRSNRFPPPAKDTRQLNAPAFAVREALYAVLSIDLTQIHGREAYLALQLVGECDR